MTSTYDQLETLDYYATLTNVAPSFHYTGDIDRLETIAPAAAGRFRLRAAIDDLRASMEAKI